MYRSFVNKTRLRVCPRQSGGCIVLIIANKKTQKQQHLVVLSDRLFEFSMMTNELPREFLLHFNNYSRQRPSRVEGKESE